MLCLIILTKNLLNIHWHIVNFTNSAKRVFYVNKKGMTSQNTNISYLKLPLLIWLANTYLLNLESWDDTHNLRNH